MKNPRFIVHKDIRGRLEYNGGPWMILDLWDNQRIVGRFYEQEAAEEALYEMMDFV